jgi:cytoskeletal protein CcmA (bactofilin family)
LRFVALLILGVAGAFLPISAAIREARRPRDSSPLDIDRNYRKDDRYFATSFEHRLQAAIGPPPRSPGLHYAELNQQETIQSIGTSVTLTEAPDTILDIDGDLNVASGLALSKEVRVSGSARIGGRVRLRALKAGGDIFLADNVIVERWTDAGGGIVAASEANLGERATATEEIVLEHGVRFRLVAARVVRTGDAAGYSTSVISGRPVGDFADGRSRRLRGDGALVVDTDFVLPEGSSAIGDVIARGVITIGRDASIDGSLHSDTDVILQQDSAVTRSVYAERSLRLLAGATIDEHAFTHGFAHVGPQVRIGTPGRVTTLMAREGLELSMGVVVHGRIVASGGGVTV